MSSLILVKIIYGEIGPVVCLSNLYLVGTLTNIKIGARKNYLDTSIEKYQPRPYHTLQSKAK